MLSAAKHLDAHLDRPFAEFTLSGSEGLSMTSKSHQEASTSEKTQHHP
jgi:hypothetical protein